MQIEKQKTAVAWLSVASNTTLTLGKIIIGILIGSVSVISEAIHSGIDLIASIIALFAVRESNKPADEDHQYGHGKFENLSGTIEAVLIFLAAGWIISEAIHKLRAPTDIESPSWGVALMLISSIVNIIVSEMLFKIAKKADSVALEADAWHLRTDVYTSLGVMSGLLIIWFMSKFFPEVNVKWIDPVSAICVAVLIIKAAYDLTKKSAKDLLDISLPVLEIELISETIRQTDGVRGFHHLRTRKAGAHRYVEFHLAANSKLSVRESHDLTEKITYELNKKFTNMYVNIHVEPCDFNEECPDPCKKGCLTKNSKKTYNYE